MGGMPPPPGGQPRAMGSMPPPPGQNNNMNMPPGNTLPGQQQSNNNMGMPPGQNPQSGGASLNQAMGGMNLASRGGAMPLPGAPKQL